MQAGHTPQAYLTCDYGEYLTKNRLPEVREKGTQEYEQMSPFQRAASESNSLTVRVGDTQRVCPLGMGRAENLPV